MNENICRSLSAYNPNHWRLCLYAKTCVSKSLENYLWLHLFIVKPHDRTMLKFKYAFIVELHDKRTGICIALSKALVLNLPKTVSTDPSFTSCCRKASSLPALFSWAFAVVSVSNAYNGGRHLLFSSRDLRAK